MECAYFALLVLDCSEAAAALCWGLFKLCLRGLTNKTSEWSNWPLGKSTKAVRSAQVLTAPKAPGEVPTPTRSFFAFHPGSFGCSQSPGFPFFFPTLSPSGNGPSRRELPSVATPRGGRSRSFRGAEGGPRVATPHDGRSRSLGGCRSLVQSGHAPCRKEPKSRKAPRAGPA